MDEKEINESFMTLSDDLKKYIKARMDLTRINMFEKSSKISAYLITRTIIILLAFFALWAVDMAFVYWYHSKFGSFIEPFLISAGVFIFFIILVVVFNKSLIVKQILKSYSAIFLDEDDFVDLSQSHTKNKKVTGTAEPA